jgi:hypothetical protein
MTDAGDAKGGDAPQKRPMTTTVNPTGAGSAGIETAGAARRSGPIHRLAVATRRLANPLAGSRWFPLWAVLRHTGRTSRTAYATPIVAFATRDGYLIPLPFGDRTQWARNLFAASGGTLRHRGREVPIGAPEIVEVADVAVSLPWFARAASRRLGLRQYVRVRRIGDGAAR